MRCHLSEPVRQYSHRGARETPSGTQRHSAETMTGQLKPGVDAETKSTMVCEFSSKRNTISLHILLSKCYLDRNLFAYKYISFFFILKENCSFNEWIYLVKISKRFFPFAALSHLVICPYMHLCVECEAHRQLCHTLPSSGQT